MARYEAVLTTPFGEIRIPFETQSELEDRLKDLDIGKLSDIVSSKLGGLIPKQPLSVKPGLEAICRFRPDGVLELLLPPKTQVEAIGLALYAHDPEAVDVETIRKITGAENPVSYLAHKSYLKYFDRTAPGKYRLSHQGKIWVSSQVLPQFTRIGAANA